MKKEDFVDSLVKAWPAPVVARRETKPFTGGAVVGRTVANVESKDPHNKVPGRMLVGRNVVYPTRSYAEWLVKRFFKKI